jgi:thioredoxin reductase
MLLDSVAVGGQAASSRIENYLGFPSGLSGIELSSRALVQANKYNGRQVIVYDEYIRSCGMDDQWQRFHGRLQ